MMVICAVHGGGHLLVTLLDHLVDELGGLRLMVLLLIGCANHVTGGLLCHGNRWYVAILTRSLRA